MAEGGAGGVFVPGLDGEEAEYGEVVDCRNLSTPALVQPQLLLGSRTKDEEFLASCFSFPWSNCM